MSLELARERLRQMRQAREHELAAGARNPMCPEGRQGCTFHVGATVFDRVTGEIGEVIGGARENVNVPNPRRPSD